MRGIIEPMCEPDKLELRHLITRRTHQLDPGARIVYWKLRYTKRQRDQFLRHAMMNIYGGQ